MLQEYLRWEMVLPSLLPSALSSECPGCVHHLWLREREFSCSALIHRPTHQHTTTAATAANSNEANPITSEALQRRRSLSGGGHMEPKLDQRQNLFRNHLYHVLAIMRSGWWVEWGDGESGQLKREVNCDKCTIFFFFYFLEEYSGAHRIHHTNPPV